MADLSGLLSQLPELACAPEALTLHLLTDPGQGGSSSPDMEDLPAAETAPEVIEKLAGPAFHASLLVRLNDMKNRALESGDEVLRFLVDAAEYYIEVFRGPAWDNPLVVAFYYRDRAALEGKPFTPRDAHRATQHYEQHFGKLLEEKARLLQVTQPQC